VGTILSRRNLPVLNSVVCSYSQFHAEQRMNVNYNTRGNRAISLQYVLGWFLVSA